MNLNLDPVKSWEAMRMLEKGLESHHKRNRIIKMMKNDGTLGNNDEENAEVFFQHFVKIFNNQNIPCDETALELITDRDTMNDLGLEPSYDEVKKQLPE